MKPKDESIVNQFITNRENTMNKALCNSVGTVLVKLADHFAEQHSNPASNLRNSMISKQKINDLIQSLSESVAKQDKRVQDAWEYVKSKLAEAVNQLDNVSLFINNQKIQYVFELKTTLALVYAALSDKNSFWLEAKKQLPANASPQDIIILQETFENSYEQDEQHRLLTLWNAFIELQSKPICHSGLRNTLAMTLNGVYPGVMFIEDMEAFLLQSLREHAHQQLESFNDRPEEYCRIIIAEISGDRLPCFRDKLEETKPDLQKNIEDNLVQHGIDPKDFEIKITNYINSIEDLSLSFEYNILISSLTSILAPRFLKEDHLLLSAMQKWIHSNFEFHNQQHEQQVISFNKVYQHSKVFKQYQALLQNWDPDQICARSIGQLDALIESYNKTCLESGAPQIISQELNIAIEQFQQACTAFERDNQQTWIENFFIRWQLARQNFNTSQKKEAELLFSTVYDPTMNKKIVVTDALLEQAFPNNQEVIEITPYLINRIFLHAIITHPKDWTKVYYHYLQRVYDFVKHEFTNQAPSLNALSLKKDSYPELLLQQLAFLQNYYQYLHEDQQEQPKNILFYVPMKQLILNSHHFFLVCFFLPTIQRESFIYSLDNDFLPSIIENSENFKVVLSYLSETQKEALITSLGITFLQSIIKNHDDLKNVLFYLSKTQIEALITSLDITFLQSIIKNCDDLKGVLLPLSKTQKEALITSLGITFLQSIIKKPYDLNVVLRYLSKTQIEALITLFGITFLQSIIKTRHDFKVVLSYLSKTQIEALITLFGITFLQSIIKTPDDLNFVLRYLFEMQIEALITSLGITFLQSIIKNHYDLNGILHSLSKTQIEALITSLGITFLQSIIKNCYDLNDVLHSLSKTQIEALITSLGITFLQSIIKNHYDLQGALHSLSKTQIEALITSLGITFLQSIIKNCDDLKGVLLPLSKTPIEALITSLDITFLQSIIKNCDDLNVVSLSLSETQKEALITSLDITFLQSIIKNYDDLKVVLRYLSETPIKKFLERLFDEDYLKFIIKNEGLKNLPSWLYPNQLKAYINLLDNSYLKSAIKCFEDLEVVLRNLSKTRIETLINSLDNNFFQSIIKYGDDFEFVPYLSETQQETFLNLLDRKFLQSIIVDKFQLDRALYYIPKSKQIKFLERLFDEDYLKFIIKNDGLKNLSMWLYPIQLDNSYLKSAIKCCEDLVVVLRKLSETQIKTLINSLDTHFFENFNNLWFVLSTLSEPQIKVVVNSLNPTLLKSIIKDSFELKFVLNYASETQRKALLYPFESLTARFLQFIMPPNSEQSYVHLLCNPFLHSIIKDRFDLNCVVQYLSETEKEAFINSFEETRLGL